MCAYVHTCAYASLGRAQRASGVTEVAGRYGGWPVPWPP